MSEHPEARYYASTRVLAQCTSCKGNIGQLEEPYKLLLEQGKTAKEALDALRITRPCCRRWVAWPVVLPIGGFVLPGGEAALNNYLGIKQRAPKPTLVVLSLQRTLQGENVIVSHVTREGFIGEATRPDAHDATEVVVYGEASTARHRGVFGDVEGSPPELDEIAQPRIYTSPGEISRGFPYDVVQMQAPYPSSTSVRSFFDLPIVAQVEAMKNARALDEKTECNVFSDADEVVPKGEQQPEDDFDALMAPTDEDYEQLVQTCGADCDD